MKLSDLKEADYNPREISDDALAGLKRSISEFGDLSGITYNRRTDRLVSGHQRVRALREEYGDLSITDSGIRLPGGDLVRVRFVDWDGSRERAANVAANNPEIGGTFTDQLSEVVVGFVDDLPELVVDLRVDHLLDDLPLEDDLSEPDTSSQLGDLEYRVIVVCDGEDHQRELLDRFEREGLRCSALMS